MKNKVQLYSLKNFLITALPLLVLLHAQRGPQDNWYITDRVAMPSGVPLMTFWLLPTERFS